LNAVEVKQTSHLLDVCMFRLFLWQFDDFFRKPLEDFPSCQGFCSISRVGPRGLCVWSNSLKGGAGNTYMPLHDHLYSDFRKPLEDFPLSSIFNTAGFVHSACTSASVVSGATRLDSMVKTNKIKICQRPLCQIESSFL
jgi:hypothetical protein